MKNAASCETWCELQDTLSTDFSNAHCGLGFYPGPRLSEGRIRLTEEVFLYLVVPGFDCGPRRPKSETQSLNLSRVLAVDGRGIREFQCELITASRRLEPCS